MTHAMLSAAFLFELSAKAYSPERDSMTIGQFCNVYGCGVHWPAIGQKADRVDQVHVALVAQFARASVNVAERKRVG
jgi:hypothetical protein